MFTRCKLVTAVVAASSLSLAGMASGQNSSESDAFQLEEIVVSARKTSESIQDIPLSVQAFTAEAIAKQQIVNIEDKEN